MRIGRTWKKRTEHKMPIGILEFHLLSLSDLKIP